ncbi:EscU/YscU/HrcU family type III secretion system export apparatus switch protein [Marivita sp.]|uniref:EscU/YscU/HrcU family type III secretion system export apparatus switch protein n=1 Tax=Marivita sp. TaxID=2003365 RepID=UPI003F6A9F50
MSEEKEDQGDKPYEASRRKLEDARKKGEIVRSQDVVNLAVISLVLIALAVIYGGYMTDIVQDMRQFIQISVSEREILDGRNLFVRSTRSIAPLLVFLFVFPFCVLLLGLIAARQVLFTSDKVQPKINRLSLLANAGKKFGKSGLFEFTKNVVKFLILAGLISLFFKDSFILFESAVMLDEHNALANIYDVAFKWLWFTLCVSQVRQQIV